MNTEVRYLSKSGNTEKVARAIATTVNAPGNLRAVVDSYSRR